MATSTAIATTNGTEPDFITPAQVELIKTSIMRGATDDELNLFLNLCRAKRLDPLTKQIYAIKTGQSWQYFSSIDGLRIIAQRTGNYGGQTAPYWCGPDGVWREIWLEDGPPAGAKVGVWKKGWIEPTWGVATFKSYGKHKNSPTWNAMPDIMLAKCAESLALRKAFPDDLSGLYVREEFTEEDRASRGAGVAAAPPRVTVDVVDAYDMIDERATDDDIIDAETGEIEKALEADPGNIEEARKALWLGAQALGWRWAEFNDKRRELHLPTLEKMTFADVRTMQSGLEP